MRNFLFQLIEFVPSYFPRVKYTGVLGLACIGLLTICDLWQLVGDHALNLVSQYINRVFETIILFEFHLYSFEATLHWEVKLVNCNDFIIVFGKLQGDLFIHTLLRAFYLLGIPMAMNFVLFYLHFAVLTQAGPGAAFVSHAFQNSLQVV